MITYEERVARYEHFIILRSQGKTYKEIGKIYNLNAQETIDRMRYGAPKKYNLVTRDWSEIDKLRLQGRDRVRYLVRERDKHSCQNCGEVRLRADIGEGKKFSKDLDVHHLNGMCGKKSKGYDKITDMDGLITLCHKCHYNRHDWAGRKRKLFYLPRT